MYFAARLPIINFFYFAFFDDATGPPPSRDDVSALANTIALVTALLFTIVAAVPMSVSTDDLNEWDWKYGVTGSHGCFGFNMYMYGGYTAEGMDWNTDISQAVDRLPSFARDGKVMGSKQLADGTTQSIIWLISSTLFSVLVLISLATLPEAEQPDHKLQYWWAVIKYVLLLASILAMLGIWKTIQVLQWFFWMVFPDNYQRQVCRDAGWQLQESRGLDDNGKQYYGFLQENGVAVTNPLTLPVSVFPVDGRFTGGNGIERYFYVSTRLWNLIVLPIVVIVCGYAGFFYEEEHIFGFKLDAGSDYDANAKETKTERLARLFAETAAAGIDNGSMKSLKNDVLLETLLEKVGIEKAGDRLMIILAIREPTQPGTQLLVPQAQLPLVPPSVEPSAVDSTASSAFGSVNPQQLDVVAPVAGGLPVAPAALVAPTVMVKALHPYSPTAPDQIAMAVNELFTLIDDSGSWWKVKGAAGHEGVVPSNYVAKVESPATGASEA